MAVADYKKYLAENVLSERRAVCCVKAIEFHADPDSGHLSLAGSSVEST